MKLATLDIPRNNIGDRAGPRYTLQTHTVHLAVLAHTPTDPISAPDTAASIFRAVLATLDADQEHFLAVGLDAKLHATAYKVIASGGIASTQVDPRVLFRWALLAGAVGLITAHNHPSGDPTPSHDDIVLARQHRDAGRMLGIDVLDSLVIGATAYTSLSQCAVLA